MTLLDALTYMDTLSQGALVAGVLAIGAAITGAVFAYIALHATSREGRR